MDWSWLSDAIKMVLGAVIGIAGKVIYDRRFAKRPDLRYVFGAPATFGTGDRETVYQNLEVSNAGTETTTDVRINFSLPSFDLVEHQVSYDGPYSFERTTDRAGMVIPNLPPGDSITLSFVFSTSKSPISKIQDLFLSAKSKDCIAKPLDRTKAISGDWVSAALAASMLAIGASLITYTFSRRMNEQVRLRNEFLSVEEILKLKKESSVELARLQVQVANPVFPGREAEIQCYIENMSDNSFEGLVEILLPSWAESFRLSERVNIGAKNRKLARWKFKVPKDVQPGKYRISAELGGNTFDKPVRIRTTEMIEVK